MPCESKKHVVKNMVETDYNPHDNHDGAMAIYLEKKTELEMALWIRWIDDEIFGDWRWDILG